MLKNVLLGRKRVAHHMQAGERYRLENGKRPGVTTTKGGLQWEVIRAGSGAKPGFSSHVTVHYRGSLVNGVEFDSSYGRNQPFTTGLLDVISGWREGLQLMNEGSIYRFVIPPEQAYGGTGAGMLIAGGSTLIFEVELIKVEQA
ncbi:MAG: FKBP-type peptidyl-prolyl cis-trans isomerase [Magnetococcales bacterium]|nr:FKBP-type peptidyl-prolyl cis-trans isomerase [Magnetococcales bacterium]MBF0262468.1 FKBP-type peptidyl-prolyl cis-trans isomerase [Magnetococcales bacterium]